MTDLRRMNKHDMLRQRRRKGFGDRCDLCQRAVGTDMHELVSRYTTLLNVAARHLSFAPQLCSLLCQPCHQQAIIHEHELWLRNIQLWGREGVQKALDRLKDAMKTRLDVELPETP